MKKYIHVLSLICIYYSFCSLYLLSQTISTDTIAANQYFDLAKKYETNSNLDSAIFYADKAQNIIISYFGEKSIRNANVMHLLGRIYNSKRKYDLAFEYNFKAVRIRIDLLGEKHPDVARSYNNIGLVYTNKGEYEKALEYHLKALQIRKENYGENNLDVAQSYNNIANVHYAIAEYDKALQYFFKALAIRKEILGEKHPYVAQCYNDIGVVYFIKAEYNKALEYNFKALQLRKEIFGEKHPDVAQSYNNIGSDYYTKGEYNQALNYHFKALQIEKEVLGDKNPEVAWCYNNIGLVYYNMGEYEQSLDYHLKALAIDKEILGEKNSDVATIYNAIGLVYSDRNEYDKALDYFFRSLKIRIEILGKNHSDVAICYNNIGIVYYNRKEYDTALNYHLHASQIFTEVLGTKHQYLATSFNNIGNVYYYKGDYDKTLEYYLKSLEIYQEVLGEKHPYVGSSHNNIGLVYEKKGQHQAALENYQKGLVSCIQNFNDTENVYSLPVISNILDWNYVLQSLQSKAQIIADTGKKLSGISINDRKKISLKHYMACDTLIDMARKEISTQSDKLALGEQASLVYKEAIALLSSQEQYKGKLKANNTSSEDDLLAYYFSEKNKSSVLLEALAGQEAQKYAGIPERLLEIEHNLKIDIAFYIKQLVEPENLDSVKTQLFRDKLFQCNRSYDSLIMVFEHQYPEYHNLKYNTKPATVKNIQNLLNNKSAMISYITGDSTITIFTLTRNNLHVKKIAKIKNLSDSIVNFRYALINTSPAMKEDLRRLGFTLYQQLFPDTDIIGGPIETLYVIPDGELSIIPFEALLTNHYTGNINEYNQYPFLIKKYNISYSCSANLFYQTFSKNASSSVEITNLNDWLAFAPVFDKNNEQNLDISTREFQRHLSNLKTDSLLVNRSLSDWNYIPPLPATEIETESIFRLFDNYNLKAKILLHKNANEQFIKSSAINNYKIIHFATHGFVNSEHPELSGILLDQDTTGGEDGILYFGEIYNLKLNADLVVLSACETGLGKIQNGEGIIGLTRALLYAGTKNIIVSLWQVADQSTSDLMVDFYKNLLDQGTTTSYSKSLRMAKLAMISERKYAHPMYWSPFILIGK